MPRCTVLIPDHAGQKLLITGSGVEERLPVVEMASDWIAAEVGAIQRALRERFGLECVVLREVVGAGNEAIAEAACITDPSDTDGAFVAVADLVAGDELSPGERAIVRSWMAEPPDPDAPPWTRRRWFARVSAWIDEQLTARGTRRSGALRQLKGAWGDSAVLAATTDAGRVFFKAAGAHSIEPAVVRALCARGRRGVPTVVACEAAHKWMLMLDAGGAPLAAPRFGAALRELAELQCAEAPHAREWLVAGIPDRRVATIRERLERVLVEIPAQLRRGGLLSPHEADALSACLVRAESACDRLSETGTPESLAHDDCQPGNVLDASDHLVFLDWSDASIAHPFFSAHHFIGMANGDATALRDAYLTPWTALAGRQAARDAFEASALLAPVYRAAFNDRMADYEAWLATNPPTAAREFARRVFTAILDRLSVGR